MTEDTNVLDLPRILRESTTEVLNEASVDYLVSLCDEVLLDRLTPARARPYARKLLERIEVTADED